MSLLGFLFVVDVSSCLGCNLEASSTPTYGNSLHLTTSLLKHCSRGLGQPWMGELPPHSTITWQFEGCPNKSPRHPPSHESSTALGRNARISKTVQDFVPMAAPQTVADSIACVGDIKQPAHGRCDFRISWTLWCLVQNTARTFNTLRRRKPTNPGGTERSNS